MKNIKKILEIVKDIFITTSLIWLSYYPFLWVNKFGLLLRGNLFELKNPKIYIDLFLNRISSLGIIFFIISIVGVFAYFDEDKR